jgi:hypothetical protein
MSAGVGLLNCASLSPSAGRVGACKASTAPLILAVTTGHSVRENHSRWTLGAWLDHTVSAESNAQSVCVPRTGQTLPVTE